MAVACRWCRLEDEGYCVHEKLVLLFIGLLIVVAWIARVYW